VDGRRVNIASFQVKVGDTVEIKDASRQLALVLEARALAERDVPDYLEVNEGKMSAQLTRVPTLGEVPYPVMMEPHLVVEYYSR
jgi:small subunit ribosomal protein S4